MSKINLVHPIYHQVSPVLDRNSHTCGSNTGRSLRSPLAGCDQLTVLSKLLDSGNSHLLLWAVSSPLYLRSCPSHWMVGEFISFYQLWPVCWLRVHFWTGVWTCIFKGDPSSGLQRAGWVCPSSGLHQWVCLSSGLYQWVCLPPWLHRAGGVCSLLVAAPGWPFTRVSVLGVQLADGFCSSLNDCGFWNISCFPTASDCPITSGYHAASETVQLSCPSSRAYAACVWQWKSLTTRRASSWDSCCLLCRCPRGVSPSFPLWLGGTPPVLEVFL